PTPTVEVATASPSLAPGATLGPDAWRDPANFVAAIDNPWLPFKPGSVWRYAGTKDGERAKDVVTVTSRTEVVAGVTCVVVDDKLWLNGKLEETTLDYYVQDITGNVWYFGEDTQELDANGNITSTEGEEHEVHDPVHRRAPSPAPLELVLGRLRAALAKARGDEQ